MCFLSRNCPAFWLNKAFSSLALFLLVAAYMKPALGALHDWSSAFYVIKPIINDTGCAMRLEMNTRVHIFIYVRDKQYLLFWLLNNWSHVRSEHIMTRVSACLLCSYCFDPSESFWICHTNPFFMSVVCLLPTRHLWLVSDTNVVINFVTARTPQYMLSQRLRLISSRYIHTGVYIVRIQCRKLSRTYSRMSSV